MFRLETAPAARVLRRGQNHLYLSPHPALRGYIAHYTITFSQPLPPVEVPGKLTLMPDIGGCFVFSMDGSEDVFWGATTKAVQVDRDFGQAAMRFFVEFLPGGANRLFGVHMRQLAEERAPLQLVLPQLHKHLDALLYECGGDLASLLPQVDALFLRQLCQNEDAFDSAFALVRLLDGLDAPKSVRELALATGYSERHLGRLFHQAFGIGVKACTGVIRINRMLGMLHAAAPLAIVAQQVGYYDQAHLDHDFKAVTGVSPSAYLNSLSDFYKEEFKF